MSKRFFVLMQAMSGNDRHETTFRHYDSVAEAEAMVQDWMSRYMAVDCVPYDQVEQVKAEHGGFMPDGMFACPEVKEPQDLMKYNGYYNLGGLGLIFHVFLTVVHDKETAIQFRGCMNREYRIDTEYSQRADEMLAHINTLVNSFEDPSIDITEAEAAVETFWKRDGFNPFEVADEYYEIPDASTDYIVTKGDTNWVDWMM